MPATFYSKPRSLSQLLGITAGQRVSLINTPETFQPRVAKLPASVKVLPTPAFPMDALVLFCTRQQDLEAQLPPLRPLLAETGSLWVAYYKSTSLMRTELHRYLISATAKPLGLRGAQIVSLDRDWSCMRLWIAPAPAAKAMRPSSLRTLRRAGFVSAMIG